jgi:hypothetical protein
MHSLYYYSSTALSRMKRTKIGGSALWNLSIVDETDASASIRKCKQTKAVKNNA